MSTKHVLIVVAALGAAALVLAGCGQKGPLYLPGYPKNAPWPQFEPPREDERPQRKLPDLPPVSDDRR